MRGATVRAQHQPSPRRPIAVSPGERVRLGERDGTWPAFRMVTRADGADGWVPERCWEADPDEPGTAIVVAPYDTTEIAPAPGERVTVLSLDEPSGWAWCRDRAGAEGWLPLSVLGPTS